MNENTHLSTQFDADLERLRSKVLEMGGLVESQINMTTKAFADNNIEVVLDVLENDSDVNAFEKSIDDDCIHIIAKRQPTASDLRLVMSISKMVTDLERSGDEVKKMAKSIRRIQERDVTVLKATTDVRHLAQAASAQIRSALDTFARLDADEARAVIETDDALDKEFKSIIRQLITFMMEDPRTITTALDIITIARAIERVGDHAKNLAEQVIYIVEGRDIRHLADES
ncbi:MAG: phosphate signaling complex protein PhoU [Methylophilaceae bacterium]|jgi:phosphate transport system protein|nr:phosphate signaling complex protein PhoU [Methylophilaceae bacterium]MDG1453186.1 phosphate signaling complex protein PhoU [Methylophilaceae bacterium]